ncbi:hypothetical protein [Robiginitalea sp. IMCC43444]|uniref:hypothetical protein n=1 Tax=Robiginitalea sp. IMCC43444 TaxID=3459121 RepID=UPI0040434339
MLDAFELGTGWMQTTIIVLSVGFPIWLIIAWVYDFSSEGIKKTEDVPFDPEVSRKKNLGLNRVIIGGLSIAVILLVVNQVRMSQNVEEPLAEASLLPDFTSSIAVMAFDDMSPEMDQEYLSDGISEEILNYLAKYKDLKVISRTSSFAYKGKNVTIDQIGEELEVAYILEGSVRKAKDTYRITVQLINTTDGAHIWSDTFDRKIEDILFVQDEIGKLVAERLNLTFSTEDVLLRKVDPEAYDLYLQGVKSLRDLKVFTDSAITIADSLLRNSIKIDPDYAPPWALLSATTFHRGIYNNHIEKDEAITIGMNAALKAKELDSNNIMALNWISNWQWHNREGNKSLKTLEGLLSKVPNDVEAYHYATHAYTRLGMPEKALVTIYKAIPLSPMKPELYRWAWKLERYRENYPKASALYNKHIEVRKQQIGEDPYLDELAIDYFENGQIEKARETLAKDTDPYWSLYATILIESKSDNSERADSLLTLFTQLPERQILESTGEDLGFYHFQSAVLYASIGDLNRAFISLEKAWDRLLTHTEDLWLNPELKALHSDPRWSELLKKLGKEFNFNYNNYMEGQ